MRTPSDPQRLLVAGDVHGDAAWFGALCRRAADLGCDAVLQLGDFGFWPHLPGGAKFPGRVSASAVKFDLAVYWIDGNHENHAALRALPAGEDGLVEIADRCWYVPRGHRWTWRGVRLGALGGAFSIDWRSRGVGSSWWPEEVTTADDVEALGSGALDVLVAHEAPAGVPLGGLALPAEDQIRTDDVRALVASAVKATTPKLVLHGHWHRRHSFELAWPVDGVDALEWAHTQVEGLASNLEHDHRAWGVLDLEPLQFTGGEAFARL
jgi:hypothetical protein